MPTFTLVVGNGRKLGKCGDSRCYARRTHGGRWRYIGIVSRIVSSMGNRLKLLDRGRVLMIFVRGQIMVAIIRRGGKVGQGFHRKGRRHRLCGWYLCRWPVPYDRVGRGKVRVLGGLCVRSLIVGVLTMFVLYLLCSGGKENVNSGWLILQQAGLDLDLWAYLIVVFIIHVMR